MKKVLLHIGTGKTGSSSIQKTLKVNRRELKAFGIGYPKFGHPTNHEELNAPFKGGGGPRAIRNRFKKNNESDEEYRHRLLSEFKKHLAQNDEMIVSAEHLFTMKPHRLKFFEGVLDEAGVTDVKVVLYCREPVSLYASQVQQKLRASSETVNPQSFHVDYCAMVDRWSDYFSDIEVREFSRDALIGGDVVEDFLSVCSEFFSEPRLMELKKTKPTNESFPLEAMVLLQKFRKMHFPDKEDVFTPSSGALMRYLKDANFDYTKPVLKPEVAHLIRANNAEDIEGLRERVGYRVFKDFSPESASECEPLNGCSSVLDIFEADDEIQDRVVDLSVNILGKVLRDAPASE